MARVNNTVGQALKEKGNLVLSVYPNPTAQNVTVQLPMQARPQVVTVVNGTGGVVDTRIITSNTGNLTFDLGDRHSGLYFLQVQCADGTLLTTPVVKEQTLKPD